MRISDWSSDVCSSDLLYARVFRGGSQPDALLHGVGEQAQILQRGAGRRIFADEFEPGERFIDRLVAADGGQQLVPEQVADEAVAVAGQLLPVEIGRASCRERVCKYV